MPLTDHPTQVTTQLPPRTSILTPFMTSTPRSRPTDTTRPALPLVLTPLSLATATHVHPPVASLGTPHIPLRPLLPLPLSVPQNAKRLAPRLPKAPTIMDIGRAAHRRMVIRGIQQQVPRPRARATASMKNAPAQRRAGTTLPGMRRMQTTLMASSCYSLLRSLGSAVDLRRCATLAITP